MLTKTLTKILMKDVGEELIKMSNVRVYIFESNNEGDEAQHVLGNAISTTEFLKKISIKRSLSKFFTFHEILRECIKNGFFESSELNVRIWVSFSCEGCKLEHIFMGPSIRTYCGHCDHVITLSKKYDKNVIS